MANNHLFPISGCGYIFKARARAPAAHVHGSGYDDDNRPDKGSSANGNGGSQVLGYYRPNEAGLSGAKGPTTATNFDRWVNSLPTPQHVVRKTAVKHVDIYNNRNSSMRSKPRARPPLGPITKNLCASPSVFFSEIGTFGRVSYSGPRIFENAVT